MENQTPQVESLFEKTESYTRATIELYKLKAILTFSDVVSTLSAHLIVFVFFSIFFLILNIGIGLWLGEELGKLYFGFFVVAGFYAFIGMVLLLFKNKWIKNPMKNAIILQTNR